MSTSETKPPHRLFVLPRAVGDQCVKAFDRFFVADAEARLVTGHAVDFRACVAPGDSQEHVGYVTFVAGAVVGGVEFVEEVVGGVGEGILLEGKLAVEVEESGRGATQSVIGKGTVCNPTIQKRYLEVMCQLTNGSMSPGEILKICAAAFTGPGSFPNRVAASDTSNLPGPSTLRLFTTPLSITIDGSKVITATFVELYTLNVAAEPVDEGQVAVDAAPAGRPNRRS